MRIKLRPLAALIMIALISAGCSTAPADTGNGNNTADTTQYAKALKFSECMRRNGVRKFPDPDRSGGLTIDQVVNDSSVDPNSQAWKKAITACKDLQPPGFTGHKRSAEDQKKALKFAQCIRDNGVKDFADPDPDGPLVDTNRIPSSATDAGMSTLNAAMKKCGPIIRDLLEGQQ